MNTIVEGKVQINDDIISRIGEAFTPREIEEVYLFDNWSYESAEGCDKRIENLLDVGFKHKNHHLYSGDSKQTIPKFFETHKGKIDLMFVDGDHTAEGALRDLENVAGRFRVLVFDDIYHPDHGYLAEVWRSYIRRYDYPSFTAGRNTLGVGVAFNLG